jgi:hypothetical protein
MIRKKRAIIKEKKNEEVYEKKEQLLEAKLKLMKKEKN